MHTFSASSFCLASSSAFRFSSSISSFVFFTGALVVPRFLASRASFSCCLIRLIRGSRLQRVRNREDECHHLQVPEGRVYQVAELGNVFLFSPGAFRLIFLFCISFVITATKRYQLKKVMSMTKDYSLVAALVHFLVIPFKASPAVKVVPKVVEALDFVLCRVYVAQANDRLSFRESGVVVEDGAKRLEKVKVLRLIKV